MSRQVLACVLVGLVAGWLTVSHAPAQQATIGTPLRGVNDSFFESTNTSWALRGKGWSARFGGAGLAVPRRGGHNAGAGANFGFGFGGGGVNGNFSGSAAQGSSRSMTSSTPSVTTMNGQRGTFSDTSQSPFVVGFTPVVGGYPGVGRFNPLSPPAMIPNRSTSIARDYLEALRRARANHDQAVANNFEQIPGGAAAPRAPAPINHHANARVGNGPADDLNLVGNIPPRPDPATRQLAVAQTSSAGRPAMSVAEARRAHAAQESGQNNEALKWMERARGAEEAGKGSVAGIYYRMAARRATGDLRQQALDRLSMLEAAGREPQ